LKPPVFQKLKYVDKSFEFSNSKRTVFGFKTFHRIGDQGGMEDLTI